MSDLKALLALLERVEKGESGWKLDSEIAVAIQCTAGYKPPDGARLVLDQWYMVEARDSDGDLIMIPQSFRYTASIDAAVALVERVLVGDYNEWAVFRGASHRSPAVGRITVHGGPTGEIISTARTPALALLAAMLKALIAEEDEP